MAAGPVLVKLKVHAGAKRAALSRKAEDAYEVWVKSPAERGLANAEALGILAGALGRSAKSLRLVKGATSPGKIVQVRPDR